MAFCDRDLVISRVISWALFASFGVYWATPAVGLNGGSAGCVMSFSESPLQLTSFYLYGPDFIRPMLYYRSVLRGPFPFLRFCQLALWRYSVLCKVGENVSTSLFEAILPFKSHILHVSVSRDKQTAVSCLLNAALDCEMHLRVNKSISHIVFFCIIAFLFYKHQGKRIVNGRPWQLYSA